jgi:putative drug exporter of the RND superfamily
VERSALVLIMVFQWGHLEGPLGFRSNGAIASSLPLFLFVVLFGLSMDYHVFILTRIKELVDRGVPTAAAIVMVAVFAIFAGCASWPSSHR